MELCKSSDFVASLVEVIEEGDQTYLVTKFVRSGDLLYFLHDVLKVDHLSEADAKPIFKQIAQGV